MWRFVVVCVCRVVYAHVLSLYGACVCLCVCLCMWRVCLCGLWCACVYCYFCFHGLRGRKENSDASSFSKLA